MRSLFVKNAHSFWPDHYENIYPDDSEGFVDGQAVDAQGFTARGVRPGSVSREVRVHGVFYQVRLHAWW